MHLELVDLLRCPRPHESTWLVAAADRMDGRHVMEGSLGCPICETVYAIRRGVAWLVVPVGADGTRAGDPSGEDDPVDDGAHPEETPVDDVVRVAAMLHLADPGGVVLLVGGWADYAHALSALVDAQFLVVDPPRWAPFHPAVSVMRTDGVAAVPVAAGSIRSVAADRPAAVVAAVRAGGRIVAPAGAPLPPGVRELARDDAHWVGVAEPMGSAPVPLRRAAGSPRGA